MISKELLKEVLGGDGDVYVGDTKWNSKTIHALWKEDPLTPVGYINIHELAHKVKEWAVSNDIRMYSGYNFKNKLWKVNVMNKKGDTLSHFEYNTEPEAVFKAGQWILENRQ